MRHLPKLVLFILGCELVGILGGFFTASSIPTWYVTLNKPAFSPPNWVFGPVWTTLYLLMGVSAFLIWEKSLKKKALRTALNYFYIQLFLNFTWSISFFGLKNPVLAFLNVVLLWIFIVLMIFKFKRISPLAAYLQIPYLLWVSFASLLNLSIVILNP